MQHASDPSLAINRHRRPQTSSAPIVTLCLHQEARDHVDRNAITKAQQQRRAHSAGGPSYPKPSSARAHQRAALLVSPSQCLGSQYRPALPPAANQDLAILGSAGALQCPIHPHAFFPTLPLPGGARLGLCLLSLLRLVVRCFGHAFSDALRALAQTHAHPPPRQPPHLHKQRHTRREKPSTV